MILLPIRADNRTIGVLNLAHEREHHFNEGHGTDFLEMLAEKIGAAIMNLFIRESSDKVIKNEKTGLYNKHFLDSILVYELNRAERYEYPLSLLFIDIDNLERINQSKGVHAGDTVIQNLAKLLVKEIRKGDILTHYKGGEFALVMPNILESSALDKAELLRKNRQN